MAVFVVTPSDVVAGVMIALGLVIFGCLTIPGAIRERRNKRRQAP